MLSHKFRLYPSKQQEEKLFETLDRCSQCGESVPKGLREREHKCPYCGFTAPRDYNSALEIKKLCLQKIRQELPESTPVEMEALPLVTSVREARSLLKNNVLV